MKYGVLLSTPYTVEEYHLLRSDLTTVNGTNLRSKWDSSVLPPKADACS